MSIREAVPTRPGVAMVRFALGMVVALVGVTWSAPARSGAEIEAYRTKMEKWVETRRIISKEKSDWEAEKQSLRASRDLRSGLPPTFGV